MKKILFTLACLLGMSTAASAFNTSAVVLLHNGNATTYEAEQISDAMEAAQDGDVVMLSEGTYPTFTIKKKISIKGVGGMTVIDGNVNIEIPNDPILTANLLEFVKINGTLYVKSPVKGMVIKQCDIMSFDGNSSRIELQARVTDSYIDRCWIGTLGISGTYQETITVNGSTSTITTPFAKGLTIINSVIGSALGASNRLSTSSNGTLNTGSTFINCYMQRAENSLGMVVNSIIRYTQWPLDCTDFINTWFSQQTSRNEDTCTLTNCYFGTVTGQVYNFNYEDLTDEGYLGNDGTIIGPLGGNTPYTLEPAVPRVTESSMKVDTEKQQLNVTLTVSPK